MIRFVVESEQICCWFNLLQLAEDQLSNIKKLFKIRRIRQYKSSQLALHAVKFCVIFVYPANEMCVPRGENDKHN